MCIEQDEAETKKENPNQYGKKILESRNYDLKSNDSVFTLLSNSSAEMPCLKKNHHM
jgi:hypothetical protein